MNPESLLVAGGRRSGGSLLIVLAFAMVGLAATSAVLSWNERDFRGACTTAARLACEARDPAMQRHGVIVLLRDARESVAVLRRVRDEGGACAADAENALALIEQAIR